MTIRWEPKFTARDEDLTSRLADELAQNNFEVSADLFEELENLARWYQAMERQPLKPRRSWVYLKREQIEKDVEALRAAGPNSPDWESLCQSFRRTLGGDEFLQVLLDGRQLGTLLLAFYENPTWANFNALRFHIETTPGNVTLLTSEGREADRQFEELNTRPRQKVRVLFALQLEDMAERVEPGLKRKRTQQFMGAIFNALGDDVNDAGVRARLSRARNRAASVMM